MASNRAAIRPHCARHGIDRQTTSASHQGLPRCGMSRFAIGSPSVSPPDGSHRFRRFLCQQPGKRVVSISTAIHDSDYQSDNRTMRRDSQARCGSRWRRRRRDAHQAASYFSSSRGFRTGSRCITQPAGPDPAVFITSSNSAASHRGPSQSFSQSQHGNANSATGHLRRITVRLCEPIVRIPRE